MRSFHLTGTVGSTIGSLDDNITNERLNDILGTLLSSWYNRFPSTKPMKIGTKNEDSTMMSDYSWEGGKNRGDQIRTGNGREKSGRQNPGFEKSADLLSRLGTSSSFGTPTRRPEV